MDFTGKALLAPQHFCCGTLGSSELCEALVGTVGSCLHRMPQGRAGSPVKPFGTLQSPRSCGAVVFSSVAGFVVAGIQAGEFFPIARSCGMRCPVSIFPCKAQGPIWALWPQHQHFFSAGEPLETHLLGAMRTAVLLPSASNVLSSNSYLHEEQGDALPLCQCPQRKLLIQMFVRSTVLFLYCSYERTEDMNKMTFLHPSICLLPPSPKCSHVIINFTFRTCFLIFHNSFKNLELPSFWVTVTLTLHAQMNPLALQRICMFIK